MTEGYGFQPDLIRSLFRTTSSGGVGSVNGAGWIKLMKFCSMEQDGRNTRNLGLLAYGAVILGTRLYGNWCSILFLPNFPPSLVFTGG
jgi:hypothetical protein